MEPERTIPGRRLALLALVAIALYLCWQVLQPFIDVLLWAIVLVILFHPAHDWLARRTGRPGLSALVSVLLVMVVFVGPLTMVATAVVREVRGVATGAQGQVQALLEHPERDPRLQRGLGILERYVDVRQMLSEENLKNAATRASQVLLQGTVGVVGGALGGLVKGIFVLFAMFYLFRDARPAVHQLASLLPLDQKNADDLLARMHAVIHASINGVLVIAVIQGTLGGLAFWALGVPSPLLWGVLMTVLSMIPMVGPGVVWVPAALVLGFGGSWAKAIALVIFGTLVIGTVDNFLRPRLVGGQAQLHPLVIFFSVLGGLQVFGMLGILLGPVVVAVTLALLGVFREMRPEGADATPV